ncbi:MFS transporter [Streptomyces sp. NPDC051956]|uniref:MFS transporter n=1 Tax=Streptomyces sp. NPDC051956 TaxID=3365677 RepID=UPI0037D072D8
MGSFTLVTNEFLPGGLISDAAADLHVSESTAGTTITAPGIIAAISALTLPVLLQRIKRRTAPLGLSLTFVIANILASLTPNYPTMLGARALLDLGTGGFRAIAVGVGPRLVPEQLGPRATALIFGAGGFGDQWSHRGNGLVGASAAPRTLAMAARSLRGTPPARRLTRPTQVRSHNERPQPGGSLGVSLKSAEPPVSSPGPAFLPGMGLRCPPPSAI